MKTRTQKMVFSAVLAALICVATMAIRIPIPGKGYIHMGDSFVLFTAWVLSPAYGFFAAGIGSALADLFSGYAIYAPATFLIKGATALVAYFMRKHLARKTNGILKEVFSGIPAECVMVFGYFGFECLLYGVLPAATAIPANLIQAAAGLVIGLGLVKIFRNKM